MKKYIAFGATVLVLTTMTPGLAQAQTDPDWTAPVAPFRIADNVYYVGTKGIGVYLIAANHEAILLDGGPEAAAPLIEQNIKALGFKLSDIKIIINTHAHLDHAGGIARLKRDTGATVYASPGDRWALEHGTHDGDTNYPTGHFPPVHVDHVLKDGQSVALGGVRMMATFTPGHTRGCTTWSTQVIAPNRVLNVVFPCSLTIGGNILVGNRRYPGIAGDYERSFALTRAMKADIVLTNHPEMADVLDREARAKAGQANAFVDPQQLGRIAANARAAFEKERAKEMRRKR
ncbi:subclass B3 metallo-beta-lactamase [Asticcacaulis sp. 201]|uniref:subclass B3 metallo-beta-lactamase n=1 Tax=Asticcacaulis sp. 201 TaxID=3028787 RepID=UPI002916A22B|nr:subclass B3 metallo-beta-lactamase [Asticcacaulis sp. 201]MDV6330269.1 subclass B3 metallo-beta-lactamase [Asticcacaulis sp. 201]